MHPLLRQPASSVLKSGECQRRPHFLFADSNDICQKLSLQASTNNRKPQHSNNPSPHPSQLSTWRWMALFQRSTMGFVCSIRAATLAVTAAVTALPSPSVETASKPTPAAQGERFMKNFVNIAKCEDSNGFSDNYWWVEDRVTFLICCLFILHYCAPSETGVGLRNAKRPSHIISVLEIFVPVCLTISSWQY